MFLATLRYWCGEVVYVVWDYLLCCYIYIYTFRHKLQLTAISFLPHSHMRTPTNAQLSCSLIINYALYRGKLITVLKETCSERVWRGEIVKNVVNLALGFKRSELKIIVLVLYADLV